MRGLSNLTDCDSLPQSAVFALEIHQTHTREFEKDYIDPLRSLRQRPGCCRVVLTTRLRRPLEHYLSFYRWGVQGRRTGSFEQWAPNNLQSVGLLFGPYKAWADGNLNDAGAAWFRTYGEVQHRRADAMLLRDYDVVTPLERFDEGMKRTLGALGLPEWALQEALAVKHAVPKTSWGDMGGPVGKARDDANARVCPNITRCAELVDAIATWDRRLYDNARERFAIGPPLELEPAPSKASTRCGCYRGYGGARGTFCGIRPDELETDDKAERSASLTYWRATALLRIFAGASLFDRGASGLGENCTPVRKKPN